MKTLALVALLLATPAAALAKRQGENFQPHAWPIPPQIHGVWCAVSPPPDLGSYYNGISYQRCTAESADHIVIDPYTFAGCKYTWVTRSASGERLVVTTDCYEKIEVRLEDGGRLLQIKKLTPAR